MSYINSNKSDWMDQKTMNSDPSKMVAFLKAKWHMCPQGERGMTPPEPLEYHPFPCIPPEGGQNWENFWTQNLGHPPEFRPKDMYRILVNLTRGYTFFHNFKFGLISIFYLYA